MAVNKYSTFIFLAAVMLLSLAGYFAWTYVENNYAALPYFGNRKIGNNYSDVQQNNITPVPAFSFTNEQGKIIDQNIVKNKIWVADFFFTRCGSICPKMSNNLQQVQQAFASNDNVKIISFTCDPEHDSPAQLNSYSKMYKANPDQWQFATGDKQSLYRFARKGLYIAATDGDGGPDDFIHSQNLVLIDRKGFIRGYYDGTDLQSVKQLITDIKKIL